MTGISNGKFCMDLNKKCTDCHQYLDYTSSHPEHTNIINLQQNLTFKKGMLFWEGF